LIAITQIDTALARRLINRLARPAPVRHGNGLKGPIFAVIEAVHRVSPVILLAWLLTCSVFEYSPRGAVYELPFER